MKTFLTDALTSALDLGIATSDDVLRHVSPDLLAEHLPKALWARLLTACLGASVVDAQLVVETIGVPNLCEHIPIGHLWRCLEEVANRALTGQVVVATPVAAASDWASRPSTPPPLAAPPPPTPPPSLAPIIAAPPPPTEPAPEPVREQRRSAFVPATTPPIPAPAPSPLADLVAELESEQEKGTAVTPAPRARSITGRNVRPSNTGIGRTTNANTTARRPQASAQISALVEAGTSRMRRGQTEVSDYDIETDVRPAEDYRSSTTSDDQLVDWPAEETISSGDDYNRKR